ncbi:MAG TPA: glycosyltransferase [Tepidisphaeraceae bacterium]|nr:glycosyltransferase [Tepidisphaeraceae bacterium]
MASTVAISPQMSVDPGAAEYRRQRIARWETIAAQKKGRRRSWGDAYHRRLERIYQFLISPGQRVLEIGCGWGDLLGAVKPSAGVGVDFSPAMIEAARGRHGELQFVEGDAHEFDLAGQTFDAIILSDLINDLWDVQRVLERVRAYCHARTRVILNFYSHLWEKPLALAQKVGMASRPLAQNWLTPPDVANLLSLAGFQTMRHWEEVLCPMGIPGLAPLCNRWLVKMWPWRFAALTNFMIARPEGMTVMGEGAPKVSVIVPARNEAGNIAAIFNRTPELGSGTELIFVEGHSGDDTLGEIERQAAANPHRACRILRQSGKGKGDAVRLGFAEAQGDILMILDADLTVAPEDLPRFFDAISEGKGEFINGVRLVYPMERRAMRLLNLAGNKFFSFTFSWLLGQRVKDSLCGTKVMWREDYRKLAAGRDYFGDFDPFGDFDLLFGASKMNLKIVDLPIRYRQRTYGATNIHRWRHGWLLLKMSCFAASRLKFV